MREQFQGGVDQRQKGFDVFDIGKNGAGTGERSGQGGEGAGLMGKVCREGIMSGFEPEIPISNNDASPGIGTSSATYLVAPFSIPLWLPRSRSRSTTRLTTPSAELPLSSIPRRARLSIAAIRASSAGEMPSLASKSDSSP